MEIDPKLVKNANALLEMSAPAVPSNFEVFDGVYFPDLLGKADKVFLIDGISGRKKLKFLFPNGLYLNLIRQITRI